MSSQIKLPIGDFAIMGIAKLRDYCLNPAHPRGRHKARVSVQLAREAQLRATATNTERDIPWILDSSGAAGKRSSAVRGSLAGVIAIHG